MHKPIIIAALGGSILPGCVAPVPDQQVICWEEVGNEAPIDDKYSPAPGIVCVPIAVDYAIPAEAVLRPDFTGGGNGGHGHPPPPPPPPPPPAPPADGMALITEYGNIATEGDRTAIVTPTQQLATNGSNIVSSGPTGVGIVTPSVTLGVGPSGITYNPTP